MEYIYELCTLPYIKKTKLYTKIYILNFVSLACGGMDNMCTVYDVNSRDASGNAKICRELLGYEGFLSSCRFVDDNTLVTGSGDMKM